MPDMTGWSKEEVIAFERMTNTKVTMKGSGFVSSQSVTKGQKVSKNDKIQITLSSEEIDGEASTSSNSKEDTTKEDKSASEKSADDKSTTDKKDKKKRNHRVINQNNRRYLFTIRKFENDRITI